MVSLHEFRCRRVILKTVDDQQHLLLRTDRHIVQVRCVGVDIRVGPFSLEPVVESFPSIKGRQRLIQDLADMYRGAFRDLNADWTVERLRHRDALAALDKRRDGLSYREVALFLYGKKAVYQSWNNPDQTMKNRVIRSVKRGQRMIGGEYKTLLK